MDIRPQDLPELRATLAAELCGPDALWFHEDRAAALSRRFDRHFDPIEMRDMDVKALLLGDLYYVAPEMVELARAASVSLPPYVLEPEDLPSEFGFLFFGSGSFVVNGKVKAMAALEWAVTGSGIRMYFYGDTDGMLAYMLGAGKIDVEQADFHRTVFGRLSPMLAEAVVHFGSDPTDQELTDPRDEELFRTIRAIWLLMQQPLALTSEVQADRPARKRLHRMGQDAPAVRVIELRRPKHSGSEPGESGRNYVHRWITRGHWRQQWYATRQVHRPVWIAPHVKGPEGAPMIGGEKVYAWKR